MVTQVVILALTLVGAFYFAVWRKKPFSSIVRDYKQMTDVL